MNTMATALMPSALARSSSFRAPASSSFVSMVPSARTRSPISATRSNSISGLMMCLAKIFGRA